MHSCVQVRFIYWGRLTGTSTRCWNLGTLQVLYPRGRGAGLGETIVGPVLQLQVIYS